MCSDDTTWSGEGGPAEMVGGLYQWRPNGESGGAH